MGQPDTRKLKDKAIALVLKGKLDKALEIYQKIVQEDPRDIKIWVKIGDLYRKVNRPEQAIEIYAKAARSFAMNGFLMQAISVNKMILELDANHKETQDSLADLYAKKGGAGAAASSSGGGTDSSSSGNAVSGASLELLETLKKKGKQAATPAPLASEPEPEEVDTFEPDFDDDFTSESVADSELEDAQIDIDDFDIDEPEPEPAQKVEIEEPEFEEDEPEEAVIQEEPQTKNRFPKFDAVDLDMADTLFDNIMNQDEVDLGKDEAAGKAELVLPNIPLFSSLEPDEFHGILEKLQLRRFDVGDKILKEGARGDSFYIIAHGAAKVMKRDPSGKEILVAEIGEGSFFGEFAFFNESVRHASVVVSKEMDALEIDRADLLLVTEQFPRVKEVLKEFYRQRLLSGLLAISPLFQPFSEEEKKDLLSYFQPHTYDAGSIVIKQGEPGDGLYLILSGEVVVNLKTPEGEIIEVAMLSEGSFIGEISLITDKPTTANCIAADELDVLKMPRKKFKEIILTHPQILEIAAEYGDKRIKSNKQLLVGGAEGLAKAGMV